MAHAETELLNLTGNFTQGGMVRGITVPGSKISVNGAPIRISPDGIFVFGFGRDVVGPWSLSAILPDGTSMNRNIDIAARTYNVQKIDGLPDRKVTPNAADLTRIKKENAEIARIRGMDSPLSGFQEDFLWPVKGKSTVSGVYGSQRILNGKPRRPHFGIDIAAPAGTPVLTPASGIVRMAEKDLFFTGGTIMIDHGHGIVSVFSHMKDISVTVNQTVTRGDVVGTVGSTGRSTGPHLDYRVNWFNERLDPALLLPKQ